MNHTRDNSEDFSLERQDRTGRGPGRNEPDDQAEAKSKSAARSSAAIVDDKALPERISRKYYVISNETGRDRHSGETRFYADERGEYLAFKIKEDRLVTRLAAAEVIRDMVSVAQHRQWEALHVRGSAEFRREAWLEAGARGIEVQGYQPTDLDWQALADRREVRNRTYPRTREVETRSNVDKDPPTARLDYDKGISGRLIDFGQAPYGNGNNAETTAYVAIELDNGQRHKVWGVGLEKAIADSKAGPGDQIQLRREGIERVLKTIKVIDAAGGARTERRQVPRNRWRMTAEKFRVTDRPTAARDPDLVAARSQVAIIEKLLARAFPKDERARESIIAAAKERIAQHLEKGHSFRRATVMEPVRGEKLGRDKHGDYQTHKSEHVRLQERER
ncbi:LPD7 domain-containing protein [Bradyrhizobium ottawaense]|uniref:LPD7 domain-containing protein n=1 Tax=Bradyrhizobium ottawaense TaxID=931866 RepID=UPI003514C49F